MYLAPPLKVFCLELGTGACIQLNWNDGATGSRKKFDDISNLLDTIYERVYVTDKRTDNQTPDDGNIYCAYA